MNASFTESIQAHSVVPSLVPSEVAAQNDFAGESRGPA